MSEREYQQKLIESKSKIVFCNWDRGKGKTYSIIQKMLKEGGSWTFISSVSNTKQRIIQRELEDWKIANPKIIMEFKCRNERIEIYFNREYEVEPLFISFETYKNFRISPRIDYIVFDDDEINLSIIKEAIAIRGLKQIIIATTMRESFEYISDKEDKIEIDEQEWIDNQIKELMKEFANIPKADNTTKRREVVLDMINRLNHMRSPKVKATYDNYVYTKPSGETDGIFVNSKT